MKFIILLSVLIINNATAQQAKVDLNIENNNIKNVAVIGNNKDKNEQILKNRVDAIEELHSLKYYEDSLKDYLTVKKANIDLQNDIDASNKNKLSKHKGTKNKVIRYRPILKVVAIWDGGALINDSGLKRSIQIGDFISKWKVIEITERYVKIANKGNTKKFTVK